MGLAQAKTRQGLQKTPETSILAPPGPSGPPQGALGGLGGSVLEPERGFPCGAEGSSDGP